MAAGFLLRSIPHVIYPYDEGEHCDLLTRKFSKSEKKPVGCIRGLALVHNKGSVDIGEKGDGIVLIH